jgi:hypothetical protein
MQDLFGDFLNLFLDWIGIASKQGSRFLKGG